MNAPHVFDTTVSYLASRHMIGCWSDPTNWLLTTFSEFRRSLSPRKLLGKDLRTTMVTTPPTPVFFTGRVMLFRFHNLVVICLALACACTTSTRFEGMYRVPLRKKTLLNIRHTNGAPAPKGVKEHQHQVSTQSFNQTTTVLGATRSRRPGIQIQTGYEGFVGPVFLGTARKGPGDCAFCLPGYKLDNEYQVVYDTGSSITWVFGKSGVVRCGKLVPREDAGDFELATFYPNCYDSSHSSSYKDYNVGGQKHNRFTATYQDGDQFSGEIVQDLLLLVDEFSGGAFMEPMEFGVADTYTRGVSETDEGVSGPYDEDHEMDGIMGLAISGGASDSAGGLSLVSRLRMDNIFREEVFSFHFDSNGVEGEILFGGIDHSLYMGKLSWVDVIEENDGAWEIPLDSVMIGDVVLESTAKREGRHNRRPSSSGGVLIDSGSTHMFAPKPALESIRREVGGYWEKNMWDIEKVRLPCSERRKLPPLVYNFNGAEFSFSGTEYFVRVYSKKGVCELFMGTPGRPDSNWLVGRPFLETHYTVFHYGGRPKIGMARAYHDDDEGGGYESDSWLTVDDDLS